MKQKVLLIAALAISLNSGAQTLPTPVAKYTFAGGTAADITGHGHNGTIIGTLPSVTDKYGHPGSAMLFTPNNYVEVPSSAAFDLQQWTLSALVKLDSFEQGECQVTKVLQRGSQYGTDYLAIEINDNYTDNNCFTYTATAQQAYGAASGTYNSFKTPPTGNLNTGTWYCITAVYAGDTMKTYINGALNHVEHWPNYYTTGAGGYPSIAPLTIGMGKGSGGATYWFRGVMDEVSIYNTPLSTAQVGLLCANTTGVGNTPGGQSIGMPYPNPSTSVLNIPVQGITGPLEASVLGMDGRLIFTKMVTLSGSDTRVTLSTADLAPGIYMLQVTAGDKKVSGHFSKL